MKRKHTNCWMKKLEFVSGYMRNNHGAVEQYGIYLIPEFMLGYDDIEIVIVAASEKRAGYGGILGHSGS